MMYKSKLQELCQQRKWSLPEYSSVRNGPNHNLRFKAIVIVNGRSFETNFHFKSLKEAQNEAARTAFLDFTASGNPITSSPGSFVQGTALECVRSAQKTIFPEMKEKPASGTSGRSCTVQDNGDIGSEDMQHLYKNQLQNYAQRSSTSLPVYSTEREGPPHASRFRSKVTVGGRTFESLRSFGTLKEAEHAAAEVALLSLLPDGVQENGSVLYKNLVQELAQKEGFNLPTYDTISSGSPHAPSFISTVKVGEETFQGQEAKTKKQAEMNAAKVAYTCLKERRTRSSTKFLLPGSQGDDASCSVQSNTDAKLKANLGPKSHPITKSNMTFKGRIEGNEGRTSNYSWKVKGTSLSMQSNSGTRMEGNVGSDGCLITNSNVTIRECSKEDKGREHKPSDKFECDPTPPVPSLPEGASCQPASPSESVHDSVKSSKGARPAQTTPHGRRKTMVIPNDPAGVKPPGDLLFCDEKWAAYDVTPGESGNSL